MDTPILTLSEAQRNYDESSLAEHHAALHVQELRRHLEALAIDRRRLEHTTSTGLLATRTAARDQLATVRAEIEGLTLTLNDAVLVRQEANSKTIAAKAALVACEEAEKRRWRT